MVFNKKNILTLSIVITLFTGCAITEKDVAYNQPIPYWETKINKLIGNKDLDEAYEEYQSFEIEHPSSKKLKKVLLNLADNYSKELKWEKANGLYEQYFIKFATRMEADLIRFLQINSKFKALDRPNHNYLLLSETIVDCNKFIGRTQDNSIKLKVKKMKEKLILRKSEFDHKISDFYEKKDIKSGSELYKEKITVENWKEYNRDKYQPEKKWYSFIVE